MNVDLEYKHKVRNTILQKIYDKAKGKPKKAVTIYPEHLGFSEEEIDSALSYLQGEGFILLGDTNDREALKSFVAEQTAQTKMASYEGASSTLRLVCLTHQGIKKVERSMNESENLKPNVTNIFHGPVGAVQTGNSNIANVTQNNGLDLTEARRLIEVIRQSTISLPPNQQEEAVEYIDDFEQEIISTNPRPSRLKAPVQALLGLASKVGAAVGFVDAVHSLSEWLPNSLQHLR
jgi:hypothetical protein